MTAPETLFDDGTRRAAAEQSAGAPFRWLALSDDPEAVELRAALEACWPLAGDSRAQLRNGLLTQRWGQHAGALAQLLTLGLLDHDGFGVTCDPAFGDRSPDILAERDGVAVVVEVRAITGMGRTPWKDGRRRRDGAPRDPGPLTRVVREVVVKKARAYRDLVAARELPYVVAVYADTDAGLAPLLRDVCFGPATVRRKLADRWGQAPDGGLFGARREDLSHLSAVLALGRVDDDAGHVELFGEWLENPFAARPVAPALRPASLRALCLDERHAPPRMAWAQGPHPPPTCRLAIPG